MKKEEKLLNYSRDSRTRINDSIVVLDSNLQVKSANEFFYETFQYKREEIENKYIYELKKIQWDIPGLKMDLENVLNNNSRYKEMEFKQKISPLGERTMALNVLHITREEKFLFLFIRDISEERSIEELLYYRFAMEELVANISTMFLTLHSEKEIEVGINCTLQAIGESIGVDRCFMDLFSRDLTTVEYTYEWSVDDFTQERKRTREVSFDYFCYSLEKNKFSKPVNILSYRESYEKIKSEEEVWLAYDNKSFLAIPLVSCKQLIGLFGFSMKEGEKIWRREDIRLLKLVGDILVNVMERREMEQKLKDTGEYAENIINTIREPLLVLDADLRIISASLSFYHNFRVKPEETEGQIFYELGNGQWNIPKLRELLEAILKEKTTIEAFYVENNFPFIGKKIMLVNARKIYSQAKQSHLILMAIDDITERKKIEREKENFFLELQSSVEKIKTLRGLLPICASCKKIRDDKGYWHNVEIYMSKYTEAEFTHGVCPECLKKLYPDFSCSEN